MAKKPQDDLTDRTVDAIILVASEVRFDGKQWKKFAEELNNRGRTTVTGKPFGVDGLRSFCNRNKIDFAKIREATDPTELLRLPQDTTPQAKSLEIVDRGELPQRATSLPQWLQDDLDSLRTLLEWWKSQPAGITLQDVMERRPVFRGKTRNSGIRVNEEILERAVTKAKQDKTRTGGNLSQLVEWLMWKYIGEPVDLVQGSEVE
ncbi:MAG: hypothetical protein WBG50_28735 [Desulfomonilaceae bacterium]